MTTSLQKMPTVTLLLFTALVLITSPTDAGTDFTGYVEIIEVVPPGSGATYGMENVTEYVFYKPPAGVEWNEAYTVCRRIGGDLAAIKTRAQKDWMASLAGENSTLFDDMFWLGLVETTQGYPTWTWDCSWGYGEFTNAWKDGSRCLKIANNNHDFAFSYGACVENKNFLCQIYKDINLNDTYVNVTFSGGKDPVHPCGLPSTTTLSTSTTSTTTTTTTTPPPPTTTATPTTTSTTPPPTTTTTTTTTSPLTTTTISTTTSAPETTPAMFCVPLSGRNISSEDALVLARELQINLTVNSKETSKYMRTLVCATDRRMSAQTLGGGGVVLICVFLGIVFLGDSARILADFKQCRRCRYTYTVQHR